MSGEESFSDNMDRSTTRSTSVLPPKGVSATDNGTSNSKLVKNRRRAGPQSGSRPSSDYQATNRKTPIKYTDKKLRYRGYFNDRQREEVTEGLRAEHGSVLRMGSKKTNLNHLLNFSVSHGEGEPYDNRYSHHQLSGYRGGKHKRWSKKSVKYNKEQFLQANCQFVVKESGDYMVNSVDPDVLVDWDLIEQVKIFGNEVPSCPICLYPPIAAKITRCGHIYCWSCMLHYLSLNENEKKTWRKCPICYESIHQKDMKSVVALKTRTYKVGDDITMSLMKREKGTTYAVPVQQWEQRESKPHNVDDGVDLCFSKLLVANTDQVQYILDREKSELDIQMAEHKGTLEGSYVQAALDLLKERQVNVNLSKAAKESIHEKLEALSQQVQPKGTEHKTGSTFAPLRKDMVEYSSAFSDEENSLCEDMAAASIPVVLSAPNLQGLVRTTSESSLTSDDHESSLSENKSAADHTKDTANDSDSATISVNMGDGEKVEVTIKEVAEELTLPGQEEAKGEKRNAAFYFYQASDGQQIYIHSLNARCLAKEYGCLEKCPPVITASIVEFEGISMSEDLRSRLRYLSHLPLTCEFKVAELALKQPLLSKGTLHWFSDDIEKRKRLRNRKKRDETRQLRQMQNTECKKYEKFPEMRALVSNDYFAENASKIVRSEMPTLLANNPTIHGENSPDFTPVGSPALSDITVGSPPDDDGGQAGMSFAQMLRAGKVKAQASSLVKTGENSAVTNQVSPAKPQDADSDSDNSEGRIPVPAYQDSFGDAIFTALAKYNKADTSKGDDPSTEANSSGNSGGKKKKKQKKLLFVNTMARGK